jgi:hypothetical protein
MSPATLTVGQWHYNQGLNITFGGQIYGEARIRSISSEVAQDDMLIINDPEDCADYIGTSVLLGQNVFSGDVRLEYSARSCEFYISPRLPSGPLWRYATVPVFARDSAMIKKYMKNYYGLSDEMIESKFLQ